MIAFFELFVFGTVWFWLVAAILTIGLITSIENNSAGWATIIGLCVAGLVYKNTNLSIGEVLMCGLTYFIVGGVWSVWKWRGFVTEEVEYYNRNKSIRNRSCYYVATIKDWLQPSKQKHKIYLWITYWPWSLIWALAEDIVKQVFELFRGMYQRITDRALKGLDIPEK